MPQDTPFPPDAPEGATAHPPDERAWARCRRRWAQGGALPWLHGEVARRMGERLSLIRMSPDRILDWDARAGQSAEVLAQAYPQAQRVAVEVPAAVPRGAGPDEPCDEPRPGWGAFWRSLLKPAARPLPRTAHTLQEPQVAPAQAQLVWSNMGLHTRSDPGPTLARWHAALAVDGFLMFSTFGPDTLREWRGLWAQAGWGPVAQPFVDMHDWGDALIEAGFADPVMDQETLRLTWATPQEALAELRTLGANAHPARHTGCRTPRWRERLLQALHERRGPDGRISLTFEIVYGHAFRPAPRPAVAATTTVSLEDMRTMVQTTRRSQ